MTQDLYLHYNHLESFLEKPVSKNFRLNQLRVESENLHFLHAVPHPSTPCNWKRNMKVY